MNYGDYGPYGERPEEIEELFGILPRGYVESGYGYRSSLFDQILTMVNQGKPRDEIDLLVGNFARSIYEENCTEYGDDDEPDLVRFCKRINYDAPFLAAQQAISGVEWLMSTQGNSKKAISNGLAHIALLCSGRCDRHAQTQNFIPAELAVAEILVSTTHSLFIAFEKC